MLVKQKVRIRSKNNKPVMQLIISSVVVFGLSLLLSFALKISPSQYIPAADKTNVSKSSNINRSTLKSVNGSSKGSSTAASVTGNNKESSNNSSSSVSGNVATKSSGSLISTTKVKTTSATSTATAYVTAAPSPSKSATLYTDPNSDVATQARIWANANPGDAALMDRLASTPMSGWFGDFSGNISSAVSSYVSDASAIGQIPVLVAYNIPERDCGGYSSGGATSATAYETWISQFATAIGSRHAIVDVEPDALAGMDCLSSSDQQTRLQLLSYAVKTLRADPNVSIYLDAGHYNWQSVSTMASRLEGADIAQATGFSLNVSNFETTGNSISYGDSISSLVGNKHFVIDTSRNGNGPDSADDWCNPNGMAFGQSPTLNTGNSLVDAYLWIKDAGESDGQCGPDQEGTSAPAAGVWWPEYALMLGQNAGW
jgi:endoglucanase